MTDARHESPSRIERIPRLTRIVLTMLITTLLIAAIWLLVTLAIGVDASSDAVVRLLIIFGGGIIVYVIGWNALVGFNEGPGHFHATAQTRWYLLAGLLAFVFDIAMLAIGLASANIF